MWHTAIYAEYVYNPQYLSHILILSLQPNILVDDSWTVHLSDFGLAVFAEGGSKGFGSVRGGNPHWLPPEAIDPESYGLDSARPTYPGDIYSFACVCIEVR